METLVATPLAKFLIASPQLRDAEVLADVGEDGRVVFVA
jgi:hypothetical protein